MTPPPVWLVALVGGCRDAAEYARGYADPRAAVARARETWRHWLRDRERGYGDGSGFGGGDGDGGGHGDGDGYGYGDGGSSSDDGDGDGHGYGDGLIAIETPDGEIWDRERALALARELLGEGRA